MALFFPGLSKTFLGRYENNPKELRVLQVICEHLRSGYTTGKKRGAGSKEDKVFQDAKDSLEKEDVPLERKDFIYIKAGIRIAYKILVGEEGEDTSTTLSENIISDLRVDGITNWTEVLRANGDLDYLFKNERETAARAEAALTEAQATLEKLASRTNKVRVSEKLITLVGELLPTLEDVLAENESLKEAASRFAEERTESERKLLEAETMIRLLEEDNDSAQGRLDSVRAELRKAHDLSVLQLALQYPQHPQLMEIAQRIEEDKKQGQNEMGTLVAQLPKTYTGGTIEYKQRFLRLLFDLARNEQEQIIGQLRNLAEQGPKHASLHTRKTQIRLLYSPMDCMVSRGADDIRFTWSKENGAITVHWLYRKGDSRVRQSEA
ncbi:hypothetical protein EPN28_02680 [Patescibacteria group bacterium]|nr:MAG: hypothetical protein EPN28_02680 [Patescibacteria group bacterium]